MNSTTAATTVSTTTISNLDFILSLISIPKITTQFFLWGYLVTFILGFTGNTLSLLTFFRPILRKTSTACLFIILAISDTIYLLVSIFDFLEFGVKIQFYKHVNYDALCRFRVFTICVARLYSAWLVVLVTVDRWIRTRFPFKANSLCTPKKGFIVAGIVLLVDVGLNSHLLLPYFGMSLPGIPQLGCSTNNINSAYKQFYFYPWTIITIVSTSFGPFLLMVILIVHMFFKIHAQRNTVAVQTILLNNHQPSIQGKRVHRQMFILMLSSVGIFFVTTFPVTIDHTVASYTVTDLAGIPNMLVSLTILSWFQALNYAINFYVHCLTSTLFRKEFLKLISINHNQGNMSVMREKNTRTGRNIQQQ